MADAEEAAAEALAGWLVGQQFGTTAVLDAHAKVAPDAEDAVAIYLTITLSDPAEDTWPIEDILALRRAIVHQATAEGVAVPIYAHLAPATDSPQEDDADAVLA